MVDAAHCEALLRGFTKRRDKEGDWIEVKLQLHPQDVPKMLNDAGLGTRFMIALVEIGDDEQPVKPKGGWRAQQAGRACVDERFWRWLRTHTSWDVVFCEGDAVFAIRNQCEVSSRAELDHNEEAGKKWDALYARYRQDMGLEAERRT